MCPCPVVSIKSAGGLCCFNNTLITSRLPCLAASHRGVIPLDTLSQSFCDLTHQRHNIHSESCELTWSSPLMRSGKKWRMALTFVQRLLARMFGVAPCRVHHHPSLHTLLEAASAPSFYISSDVMTRQTPCLPAPW